MADIGYQFDATSVAPNTGFEALPTDWYNCMITDSEVKRTKDGQGAYIEFTFKVLDGKYKDRLFWDRLNLWNKNPVAVEIAQGSLSALCHATGVFQVQNTQVLHGIPLMARVVEKPAEKGYDASNDVKSYTKIGERVSQNAAGVVGGIQAPTASPQSAPWGGAQVPATPPAAPPIPQAPPVPEPTPPAPPAFTPPGMPAGMPPTAPPAAPAPPPAAPAGPPTVPPWATGG